MAESKANQDSKRAVIVGIPGVGKTTVISRAAELLVSGGRKASVVVFGTLMFEEAKKTLGIKDRDEMRKQPVAIQRHLQELAAQRIADMRHEIVLVDTHLFINTGEGYYPGLPMRLLNIMNPTNLIMIAADPQEIVERRKADQTRNRDTASVEDIRRELDISRVMVASCSILTGAPFALITNNDGSVEAAAEKIVRILAVEQKS